MKRIFVVLSLLLVASAQAAPANTSSAKSMAPVAPAAHLLTPKFDFQGVSVAQVIALLYGEVLKQPYVLDPKVLSDQRLVSFRFDASKGELRIFLRAFLDSLGFVIKTRSGVDFVTARPVEQKGPMLEVYIYHPQYRSTGYLTDLLTPLFSAGGFTSNRSVRASTGDKIPAGAVTPPQGSAAALIDQDSDTLIFQGTAVEIERLRKTLPQVDTAGGEVAVKAVVYEVSTGNTDGTAFSLALNLLGGKLGVSVGSDVATLNNAVTFKAANFEMALSALAGDSRFKVVSTPRVRVKSGGSARLTVGQDVPTLSSVTYPQGGGNAVQLVEYRSSGVILNLSPVVRGATVDMTVDQQISDFAKTETGVNSSPTLTKRALTTTVSAADGELIVLGGLTTDKDSQGTSGLSFLPKFMRTSSQSSNRTEVLLLLQATKI
ncbi:type II secretion system protein GspD [Chromobacterium vaccinii]|uniref:type II secretion system protein GspD n=1 Tax=Chromobacterium vaccinii TaxID=1108595 RepID=UPI001E2C2A8F|nr:type II secretory pathway protein [Chromobacterium vaccinii]MCD4500155.1 type II secretory pathway protein [Chromobacterium vaccinii]